MLYEHKNNSTHGNFLRWYGFLQDEEFIATLIFQRSEKAAVTFSLFVIMVAFQSLAMPLNTFMIYDKQKDHHDRDYICADPSKEQLIL